MTEWNGNMSPPNIAQLGSPKLRMGLYALAYFLAQVLAFQFSDSLGLGTSIWPAAGVALAALLLSPRRIWPALVGHLFVAGLAANLTTDRPFIVSVGFMVANMCESTASAWLIVQICGDRVSFSKMRDILTLAFAAFLINAVTSLLGAGVASFVMSFQFWRFYQTWWLADGLGILLITPMIVLWANTRWSLAHIRWGQILEKASLFLLCCLATWLAFSRWESATIHVDIQPYLLFAFILWSAIRFGPRGTATILSAISLIAVCCMATDSGVFPLGGANPDVRMLTVQMFLGVMGLCGLILTAAVYQQKEGEKKYCSLIENSHDIIYTLSSEGVFTFVSPAWTVMLGHPSSQIVGQSFQQFVHPDDLLECLIWLRKVIETGQRQTGIEYRVCHADGSWCWHTSSAAPFRNGYGTVIGFDGIAHDITERKRLESYREMGQEVLQLLNEPGEQQDVIQRVITAMKARTGFASVGLRLQDGEDFPYYVQQGLTQEFLLTENTLLQRNPDGGICRDKDGSACLECTCGLVISGKTNPASPFFTKGGSFWTNNFLCMLNFPADQDPRLNPRNLCIHEGYASVALIPLRDKKLIIGLIHFNDWRLGRFTLEMIELLENIAAHIGEALMRRKAEKILQDMAESKVKFTSTVSHELRSPLAMIKESTNLVLEEVLGPLNDGQKEMLSISKNNIARLGRLVNNVLEYQKMEAKKAEYEFQEHDVNELVKEANINATLFAGDRKADILMDLGADLPRAKFDTDKIMQVLINLLANAIKYSESGPVVIQTRLENSEVQISVQDSGQGIYPEELDEIFKPFVQAKGKKKGGTGLGLAIAKEIVLAHHGRIWVESEIGKGSTFYFTLLVGQVGQV